LRNLALDILEAGLEAADPGKEVRKHVRLTGNTLVVYEKEFDLSRYARIFVIGAGKATLPIAEALEEMLGERISDGVVILKKGSQSTLRRVQVFYGGHPIPDEDGYKGAKTMLSMTDGLTEKDLVIAIFTGGSSALLPLPAKGVSLADKQEVNRLLLSCGAEITQINAVRKHLSQVKGGLLAKHILPATIINFTVSDVVGDMLDYITDPTVADTSTFEDARQVVTDFDLWERLPQSVVQHLRNGGTAQETPKDFNQDPVHSFIVLDSAVACQAAAEKARQLGFNTMILTTMLKGEAREAGSFLAAIAHEVVQYGRPLAKPCAVILGGENTVTLNGNHGLGGPNQELVLSAALGICGLEGVVIAAIDTDGTDGPTDICGAMVDGSSALPPQNAGHDLNKALRMHDVSSYLEHQGDALRAGQTGTNVNDLKLILIG
jgi:hydroxypyruvate reductase/glycerate 2-kinase